MRVPFTVMFLPAILLAVYVSNTSKTDGTPLLSIGPDYETLAFELEGQTVYGVRCKKGGTECDYKWDSLCAEGKAANADSAGHVQTEPSYSYDAEGRPVRMYVCR